MQCGETILKCGIHCRKSGVDSRSMTDKAGSELTEYNLCVLLSHSVAKALSLKIYSVGINV